MDVVLLCLKKSLEIMRCAYQRLLVGGRKDKIGPICQSQRLSAQRERRRTWCKRSACKISGFFYIQRRISIKKFPHPGSDQLRPIKSFRKVSASSLSILFLIIEVNDGWRRHLYSGTTSLRQEAFLPIFSERASFVFEWPTEQRQKVSPE
jgi:hypothetical protein